MATLDSLHSPLAFLGGLIEDDQLAPLKDYESWWLSEGQAISETVDRAGTPWLRMFDQFGKRTDEILFPSEYWKMLKRGYQAGVIWRAFADNSPRMHYLIDYVTCFFDAGLGCPYIVSMSTAVPLKKYGSTELQERFLPHLLARDESVWQGATWMTEAKGGSDLGATVETTARKAESEPPAGLPLRLGEGWGEGRSIAGGQDTQPGARSDRWILNGDKYFSSNIGAELAIVAARPESGTGVPLVNHAQDARATPPVNHAQDARATPPVNHAQDARATPHGLALFLVPRYRSALSPGSADVPVRTGAERGELNYFIRRIKNKIGTRSVPTGEVELRDSEAYLLGKQEWGIYLILESLNLSRVGNIVGSVALAQRALADALSFAQGRVAFGKPIIKHPLLRRQFEERFAQLQDARALMWEAMHLLEEVWLETPRYSDRYHLFRLVAHLAKYWTAELAVQFAKWNMEVHGGMGVLAEYSAERWLREAMILPIWEGTPHRQMLDGLEVMERKRAHEMLFDHLAPHASPSDLNSLRTRIEQHLQLPAEEKEAGIEPIFRDLAEFTARTLGKKGFA